LSFKLKIIISLQVLAQPSHENKDNLVDGYQDSTEVFAQLAEATSHMAVQPTTQEQVKIVLNGFFNTNNDLNDALADEINVLLQAQPNKTKEVFPKTEFAYRELEYLVNDLSLIIAEERAKLKRLKLFPILLRALELAKDSGELSKEVFFLQLILFLFYFLFLFYSIYFLSIFNYFN